MSGSTWWGRVKSAGPRVPNSIALAAVLFALDAFVLVDAVGQALGLSDMSSAGVQILGDWYRFDGPAFPWIVGVLAAFSLVAGWQASQLRRLPFVMGVGLVWVALAGVAIATGSGPGLLIERVAIVAALMWGRRAFG
jgi:hypothetical protein